MLDRALNNASLEETKNARKYLSKGEYWLDMG